MDIKNKKMKNNRLLLMLLFAVLMVLAALISPKYVFMGIAGGLAILLFLGIIKEIYTFISQNLKSK